MIIVITGPTCTHKSEIAVKVAQEFNAEIVNADAFQVYKELDVGTAKPSKEQLETVKHHLYSYKKINEPYSIFDYQKDARKVIDDILKRKKNVVLVGGSGLYIRATLYDYSFESKPKKKVNLKRFDKLSNETLHAELKKIDPAQAKIIHPNNRRRVLRALEIYYTYGKTKTAMINEQAHKLIYPNAIIYGLIPSNNDELYEAIDKRVDKMFMKGLVQEAKKLKKKYDAKAQALQAIGYKEIIENPNDIQLAKKLIKNNTHHYAKRQVTFIKHQYGNDIRLVEADHPTSLITHEIRKIIDSHDQDARTKALIGEKNLAQLKHSHVAIFGIGGVGGTALEALARSGVGELTIIDADTVVASNLNRQVLFNNNDVNEAKVKVANHYLKAINPKLKIHPVQLFFSLDNYKKKPVSFSFKDFDYVIDAIDSLESKANLIKLLLKHKIPFVSSLGMGNRFDPTKLVVTTLDKTHDDPLAKALRHALNKEKINLKKIPVVTSNEIPTKNGRVISSMMIVPSAAGLLLASEAIKCILKKE